MELLDASEFGAEELRQELENCNKEDLQWLQEEIELLFGQTNGEPLQLFEERTALQLAFFFRKNIKVSDPFAHQVARTGLRLIETRFPHLYRDFLNKPD